MIKDWTKGLGGTYITKGIKPRMIRRSQIDFRYSPANEGTFVIINEHGLLSKDTIFIEKIFRGNKIESRKKAVAFAKSYMRSH
jgi:hypothetical protein